MKLLLIIFILVFAFTAFGQTDAISDYSVYKDPKLSFSVAYPKDWSLLETTNPKMYFAAASKTKLADFNIVTIYNKEIAKMSPADIFKEFKLNPQLVRNIVREGLPDAEVESSGITVFNNQQAFWVISKGTLKISDKEIKLQTYYFYFIDGGYTYTLTFRTSPENFYDYFVTFKAIASTFKLPSTLSKTPKNTKAVTTKDYRSIYKNEWTIYDDNKDFSLAYNLSTMIKQKSLVQIWVKETSKSDNSKTMTLFEIDCALNEYRLVNMTVYNADGSTKYTAKFRPSFGVEVIVPDSTMDILGRKVCKAAN